MITENFENAERGATRAYPNNNRDFERHGVYTPRNPNIHFSNNIRDGTNKDNGRDNKFRFKNSLIITPYYEIEFHDVGGIKYIKNHENRVFFTNDGIYALTNNIQKIPVLLKRGINKQPIQKKLIVEEKYNYEEKYEIYKNIILYYDENRIDFQISFNKLDIDPEKSENTHTNIKDITTEFSLNLSVSGIDEIITYKKYSSKDEYKSLLSELSGDNSLSGGGLEYLMVGCEKGGGACMTVYPGKKLLTSCNHASKSLCFTTPNLSAPQRNYINLKIYLENYRVT